MSGQDRRDAVDASTIAATLHDLLALWRRSIELELRVSSPATVVTYDPATQTAQVVLGLLPVQFIEGEEVPAGAIVIPTARVRWIGGSLGYVSTPLVPGDTGHVVFTDRCLAQWLLAGGSVDPINGRTHALADAVFEPGLRHNANPITPPTDLTATVVEGPLVRLGSLALNGVVLDGTQGLAAALTSAVSALTTIVGTPVPEPPAPGAGAAIDALAAALLAVVAAMSVSTKVLAAPTP